MKKQYQLIVFVLALLFAFACSEDSPTNPSINHYTYSGYDSQGNKIILGTLTIKRDTSSVVTGTWKFQPVASCNNVGPQLGAGNFAGSLDSQKILQLNLNPDMVDNNVFLYGHFEMGQYVGTWSYAGFPGVINQGTFEAHKR